MPCALSLARAGQSCHRATSACSAVFMRLLTRVGIVAAGSQSAANAVIEKALTLAGADSTGKILVLVAGVATAQMVLSLVLNWWSIRLARSYQARRQMELFGAFM